MKKKTKKRPERVVPQIPRLTNLNEGPVTPTFDRMKEKKPKGKK